VVWQEPGGTSQREPCRGETPNVWPFCMVFPKLLMPGEKQFKKNALKCQLLTEAVSCSADLLYETSFIFIRKLKSNEKLERKAKLG